MNSRKMA